MIRRNIVAVPVAVLITATGCAEQRDATSRQDEVATKGAGVMPFDLDRTTHIFERHQDGGIQRVVADDPSARGQIRLIRQHLRKEARAFSRGDFGDPAAIHGADMPGLEELEESYVHISVTFAATPEGARIRYRSDRPRAVQALHRWFKAQLMDHGDHARRRS